MKEGELRTGIQATNLLHRISFIDSKSKRAPFNLNVMFNLQRLKTLFYLNLRKGFSFPKASPALTCYPSSPLSLRYTTTTSDQQSFTVSYLANSCGLSPETALNISKQVHFDTSQKPDSVLAIFRSRGFSNCQIHTIIRRAPNVLVGDPHRRVLPKFEFLRSKGASSSEIVQLVTRSPRILYSSLDNSIIPVFELVRRFLQSDKKTIGCLATCRYFFGNDLAARNIKFLLDEGVTDSSIAYLLSKRPSVLLSFDLRKAVDEVNGLGFDPSKLTFGMALLAKTAISKSRWEAKVDAFKKWGWSEEMILEAFRRNPLCMLVSDDKINEVMRFWVNQLGWSSLALVRRPEFFGYSLEKRIMPRAFVVQYLLGKGLINKNGNLLSPFTVSEKVFLEKYVKCLKEERSLLLKLYQEKMNVLDGVASAVMK